MGSLVLYRDNDGDVTRWGLYQRITRAPHSRMWVGSGIYTHPFEEAFSELRPREERSCPLELALLVNADLPQVYYD